MMCMMLSPLLVCCWPGSLELSPDSVVTGLTSLQSLSVPKPLALVPPAPAPAPPPR